MNALRNYTRWVAVAGPTDGGYLVADLLGAGLPDIVADPDAGTVQLSNRTLSPDEARLVGVRLIDAVLADGPRAIRTACDRRSTDPGPDGVTPRSAVRPGAPQDGTR